jgi:hypothetical protein
MLDQLRLVQPCSQVTQVHLLQFFTTKVSVS